MQPPKGGKRMKFSKGDSDGSSGGAGDSSSDQVAAKVVTIKIVISKISNLNKQFSHTFF